MYGLQLHVWPAATCMACSCGCVINCIVTGAATAQEILSELKRKRTTQKGSVSEQKGEEDEGEELQHEDPGRVPSPYIPWVMEYNVVCHPQLRVLPRGPGFQGRHSC